MNWLKKNLSSIILVLIFLLGLSLLLYPSFSDYWNSFHQSHAIASYAETVSVINSAEQDRIWKEARIYNETLVNKEKRWIVEGEKLEEYNSLLNIAGNGIMGYVEIPTIAVELPIYHGVSDSVLQIAIGHLEGSSLPVGGQGTHCAISGHRGLPSAKLFTNLDELAKGDVFLLHVMDEILTYEVDQIRIVEPADLSALEIEEGKDLCTLITCTPYGVNSHRLLVRGHRIENIDTKTIRVTADAMQIDPVLVAPAVAVPILLVLLVWLLIKYRKKR